MKFVTAAAAGLSLAAGAAQAQIVKPDVYGSLGYAKKEDSNLEAGQVRLGARFNPYLGVEGEFALGTEPNTITFPSVPPLVLKNQLRHEFAVYGVGFYPVTPNFDGQQVRRRFPEPRRRRPVPVRRQERRARRLPAPELRQGPEGRERLGGRVHAQVLAFV
jgi:hypothetical protein